MWTSFHHQPEAQHPKSSAFHKLAGRLPHLLGEKSSLQLLPLRVNSRARSPSRRAIIR